MSTDNSVAGNRFVLLGDFVSHSERCSSQRHHMIDDKTELALDLSNIIGGLPSQGYVVISNLPRGSRLSHGYDSGDNTWTLMVDELPGLKFLPGPVRGVVSLKAQIFDPTIGGVGQTRKEFPLVLHTDDAFPWCETESKVGARNTTAPAVRKAENRHGEAAQASAEARVNPNTLTADLPPGKKAADPVSLPNSAGTVAAASSQGVAPAAGGQANVVHSVPPSARGTEQSAFAKPSVTKQKLWSAEAERRFTDAVEDLRREADEVLRAAELRHRNEIEELSRAIAKQHELITTLKKEIEQAVERHREAERNWQKAEAERMKAAQDTWAREKEGLKREATLKEQEFAAQLKKSLADAERLIVKSRAEYESAVLHCLGETERQLRTVFQTKTK
ncbi:MAG TPA: hypothetical protein VED46_14035 [Alphaproteobacteria bacterium]|nr:hypothetical protein [Alphaproteobacteria bacterium]